MDVNLEKGTISIYSKSYKLDTLATKLAGLNGKQVYDFFSGRGMMLPRKMHRMALFSVLNERIKELDSNSLTKEYFQRLQYYKNFTELQLENLYNAIAKPEDFKQYRINLFKLFLINYVGINLNDGELMYLNNVRKLSMEPFEEYVKFLSAIFNESPNGFDGEDMQVLQDVLPLSASVSEINKYGEKYNLGVESRLTKEQLIDYITYWLLNNGEYSEELEMAIKSKTVAELNAFCKKKGIEMSSCMTKKQTVIYLFYYLSQCEISTTSINHIESLPIYEPISFRIDLSVASAFGQKEAKKIIYLDSITETNENGESVEYYEEMPEALKKEEKKHFSIRVNKRYGDTEQDPIVPVIIDESHKLNIPEPEPEEEIIPQMATSEPESVESEEAEYVEQAESEEAEYAEQIDSEEVEYVEQAESEEEAEYVEQAESEEETEYVEQAQYEEAEYVEQPEYTEELEQASTNEDYVEPLYTDDASDDIMNRYGLTKDPAQILKDEEAASEMPWPEEIKNKNQDTDKPLKAPKPADPEMLAIDEVYENDKYCSKELINLDKSHKGAIALATFGALILAAIVFIIIKM